MPFPPWGLFMTRRLFAPAGLLLAVILALTPGVGQAGSSAAEQSQYEVQRGINSGLETEIARLREALNGDVCAAKDALPVNPRERSLPLAPGPSGVKPSARTVGDLLEQATVLVLSPIGQDLSSGTGFFIAPGKVLTNRHVVGEKPGQVLVVNKALGGIKRGTVVVVSQEESRDYALISVELDNPNQIPYLSVKGGVRRMDRVSAWGFPGMVTADDPKFKALMAGDIQAVPEVVYTEGVVSVVLEYAAPVVVHTALISHGNSGGPLVDEQGVVVGINTYINLDSKSYRQSCMSLAGTDVIAFLKGHQIPVTIAGERP
jgi:serine protease Do